MSELPTAASIFGGIAAATLALLFAWSVIAKARALAEGTAGRIIAVVPGPEGTRLPLLWSAAIAETLAVVTLLTFPKQGLVFSALLLGVYTARLATLGDRPCQCFGEAFQFGGRTSGRVVRNAVLIAAALAALLITQNSVPHIDLFVLGAAGFVVLGVRAVDLIVDPRPHGAEMRRKA